MINKEIVITRELPLYEVQEVSLLDAMLLLKGYTSAARESSITRAAERLHTQRINHTTKSGWSMTGT